MTDSSSLNLQIFCIIFVFFVSLSGFYLPIYLTNLKTAQKTTSSTTSPTSVTSISSFSWCSFSFTTSITFQIIYLCLKCCGSGIILGVSLLHLLSDAVEDLGQYFKYPGSFFSSFLHSFTPLTFSPSHTVSPCLLFTSC